MILLKYDVYEFSLLFEKGLYHLFGLITGEMGSLLLIPLPLAFGSGRVGRGGDNGVLSLGVFAFFPFFRY